jgi:hypothetical protein
MAIRLQILLLLLESNPLCSMTSQCDGKPHDSSIIVIIKIITLSLYISTSSNGNKVAKDSVHASKRKFFYQLCNG